MNSLQPASKPKNNKILENGNSISNQKKFLKNNITLILHRTHDLQLKSQHRLHLNILNSQIGSRIQNSVVCVQVFLWFHRNILDTNRIVRQRLIIWMGFGDDQVRWELLPIAADFCRAPSDVAIPNVGHCRLAAHRWLFVHWASHQNLLENKIPCTLVQSVHEDLSIWNRIVYWRMCWRCLKMTSHWISNWIKCDRLSNCKCVSILLLAWIIKRLNWVGCKAENRYSPGHYFVQSILTVSFFDLTHWINQLVLVKIDDFFTFCQVRTHAD